MQRLCFPGVPDEEAVFKKPREVVHRNTRFLKDPFSQALSKSQLQQAAALNAQVGGEGGRESPSQPIEMFLIYAVASCCFSKICGCLVDKLCPTL